LIRPPKHARRSVLCASTFLFVLAACNTEDVKVATLSFAKQRGFDCKDATTGALLASRITSNQGEASLVIDYLRLGGVPHCRPAQLVDWCHDKTCPTVPEARVCMPISVPSSATPVVSLLRTLQGTVVSPSAPEDYVLVRAVVTTEACDQVGAKFDPHRIAGCVYSCPTLLGADGAVLLDLDTTDNNCEGNVDVCAALNEVGASGGAQ